LLPQLEVVTLLVDNYFDRIYWFMLVFHQSEFRVVFLQLYHNIHRRCLEIMSRLGFVCVLLAVCVISLPYTSHKQKQKLVDYGIDEDALQEKLLTALRLRLLDIVSLDSIEAVQTCVLLGSFHVFHGEPELTRSICGCCLRITQALNLHRRPPSRAPQAPDLDDPAQRAEKIRKQC